MADNLRVLHYSCGLACGDPKRTPVGYIEVHATNKPADCFDAWDGEAAALTRFAQYLRGNTTATWIGWRCLRPDYGFKHLEVRYHELTGNSLQSPAKIIDLKEFLKDRYGEQFALHPRLESAARSNGLTLTGLLTGAEAAEAFRAGNYGALRQNTGRRCSIIRSLYRLAEQGHFAVAGVGGGNGEPGAQKTSGRAC